MPWGNELENRDLGEAVEPDRVDRPADSAGNEDVGSTGRLLETAGVILVSDRQHRSADERDVYLPTMGVAGDHQINT